MKAKEIKFTERELAVLHSTADNMDVLSDIRIIKKLVRAGIVELHAHTGDYVRWNGRTGRAWYVYDVERTTVGEFTFLPVHHSGSFYPYVAVAKLGGL